MSARAIDHSRTVVASSQEEIAKDQTVTMDWLLEKYPAQSRKKIALDHNEGQNETLSKMFSTRMLRMFVSVDSSTFESLRSKFNFTLEIDSRTHDQLLSLICRGNRVKKFFTEPLT